MSRLVARTAALRSIGSFALVAVASAAAAQFATAPADARHIALGSPHAIVDVDGGKIKGQPSVLAWSAEAAELYLQATERDRRGAVTSTKHYIVNLAERAIQSVGEEPTWASKYWLWKSAQASPALATFKIEVEERTETKRSTASPVGGDLAKGGTSGGSDRTNVGSTMGDAAAAAYGSQEQHVYALRTKGYTIGEWINEPVTPGSNFAWAPAPARLLVFAKRDGGPLVAVDGDGRKQELEGARSALLPAWSADATKLAWLERTGRNRFELTIADVVVKP